MSPQLVPQAIGRLRSQNCFMHASQIGLDLPANCSLCHSMQEPPEIPKTIEEIPAFILRDLS